MFGHILQHPRKVPHYLKPFAVPQKSCVNSSVIFCSWLS